MRCIYQEPHICTQIVMNIILRSGQAQGWVSMVPCVDDDDDQMMEVELELLDMWMDEMLLDDRGWSSTSQNR